MRKYLAFLLICIAAQARGQAVDALLSSPGLWHAPRTGFVDQYRDLGFYWLSNSMDRAETHKKGLTLFGNPVYEVDADFQGQTLSGLTISIYNRGDAGDISREEMTSLATNAYTNLTAITKVKPQYLGENPADAVKVRSFEWQTPAGEYKMEYSFTDKSEGRKIPFRAEFIRLAINPPQKQPGFMEAALAADAPKALFNGPSHVKHDPSGDVRIETVPMVDQGQKGYCVVATTERVMRYYGRAVDEHELAELANTSASKGTSNDAMIDSLKKLSERLQIRIRTIQNMDVQQILNMIRDYNMRARIKHVPEIPDQGQMLDMQRIYSSLNPEVFKDVRTRNRSGVERFQQQVRDNIDQGIPILWSVMLGIEPEPREPQTLGGHMRLIIGYNDQTNEILYSDSWGPGHELKRMPADDAWTITTGMNTIETL